MSFFASTPAPPPPPPQRDDARVEEARRRRRLQVDAAGRDSLILGGGQETLAPTLRLKRLLGE